jgi:hypothetical protein
MYLRILLLAGSTILLSGCKSHEGLYAPSCVAYAGSEIQLEDGRFVWTKFTDQVRIDEQGNKIDPFPGFPLRGQYTEQGARLTLLAEEGGGSHTMFLVRIDGGVYLYTAEEAEAFEASGERPACPLQRQVPGTEN